MKIKQLKIFLYISLYLVIVNFGFSKNDIKISSLNQINIPENYEILIKEFMNSTSTNQTYNINATNPISQIASNIDKVMHPDLIMAQKFLVSNEEKNFDKNIVENISENEFNSNDFKINNSNMNKLPENKINHVGKFRRALLVFLLCFIGSFIFLLAVYLDKKRKERRLIFNGEIQYTLMKIE